MMHITDWYPTLCDIAGITPTNRRTLDGYSMLNVIQNEDAKSERTEILLNIDPYCQQFCGGIIMNEWKLITGNDSSSVSEAPCYLNSSYKGPKPPTIWCPLNNTNEEYTTIKCNGIQPIVNETF